MICALAIASVTERTCVLSIIPVVTFIRITQGIRSGGMQIEIFVKLWQITTAARSLIDLYSNWTIEILRGELLGADIKVQRELLTSTGIALT